MTLPCRICATTLARHCNSLPITIRHKAQPNLPRRPGLTMSCVIIYIPDALKPPRCHTDFTNSLATSCTPNLPLSTTPR